jgi:hypothetical protein
MMRTWFNINPVRVVGSPIEGYDTPDIIEGSLNLRQASLVDAVRYGGPLTRAALSQMNLRGDRKYTVVDTKVNMLLPGFIPAIPGWHTDGVPRGPELDPGGKGIPMMSAQIEYKSKGITPPRYHLLVTGTHSQTQFVNVPMYLEVEDDHKLYENMTRRVDQVLQEHVYDMEPVFTAPSNTVVEWDWWNIHRAVPATASGWRYLIRVTETDYIRPRTDANEFIRSQTQVYVKPEFGW